MCLKTEELNMKYDCVKKKYIGIGYKSCNTYDNGKTVAVRFDTRLKIGVWYDALKVQNKIMLKDNEAELTRISSHDSLKYPAGFHIFLNPKHAQTYGFKYVPVWLVEYCDVIGLGKNKYNQGNNSGPCVIAHQMRIVGKIN